MGAHHSPGGHETVTVTTVTTYRPRRTAGIGGAGAILLTTLLSATAHAAVPIRGIEEGLARASADLGFCGELAGPADAPVRWTAHLRFRAHGTEVDVHAAEGVPELATACIQSRLSEVLEPRARGLDWVRTLERTQHGVRLLPVTVSEQQLAAGACLEEVGAGALPGGLIGLVQPAGQGLRALVDQADHPPLVECLVAAGGPAASDDTDEVVLLHVAAPPPPEARPWSHTTLEGPSTGADGLLATLDREWLQHGVGAHPYALSSLYTALCDEGVSLACGFEQWHVPDAPLDLDRLRAAFAPACEAGDPVACVPVAWRLIQGAPGRYAPPGPDPDLGYALLDGACDRGVLRACSELAIRPGRADAASSLLDTCAEGDGHGCYHLAMTREGDAPFRSRALYAHAIAAGEPAAWHRVGKLWETGVLGGYDAEAIEEAWTRGCASGDRAACRDLIEHYRAHPLGGDIDRAGDRACLAGDADACHTLGIERLQARNDPTGAADALERGCTLGHRSACADLGALWHHAPLLAPAPEAALVRLARACAPGDPSTWRWCAAYEHVDGGGRLGSLSARGVFPEVPLGEALDCVGELGRIDLRLVIGGDGRLAEAPRIVSSLASEAAGVCARAALKKLRLPAPRDGGTVFATLILDGPSHSTRIDTFPRSGALPSGAIRVASIHETAGSDTLGPVTDALQRDGGLGLCFDGSEAWPGVIEMAVKPTGRTVGVKLVTSTGSDEVDACLVARTQQLGVVGGVRVRTPIGFQIGPGRDAEPAHLDGH